MDSTSLPLTSNEVKLFHGIDSSLYQLLLQNIVHNPLECTYIVGLWIWLERVGYTGFINKILSLPPFQIYQLAEEARACLKCLNPCFPFSSELCEIPITCKLLERNITLRYFHQTSPTAFKQIQDLVNGVLLPTVSDIAEKQSSGDFASSSSSQPPAPAPAPSQGRANPRSSINSSRSSRNESRNVRALPSPPSPRSRIYRTMFVTFSRGYPVTQEEVTQYFTRIFGHCIESFDMQGVGPREQSLYARAVFTRASTVQAILNGHLTAKFNINGKNVWLRQFVPRE